MGTKASSSTAEPAWSVEEKKKKTGARRRLWKREKRERENTMYQQPHYQQPYDPEMGYGKTEEEGGMDYAAFMEKEVRRGFIRKVFSILAVQLLVTFGCAVGFASSAPLKAYATQTALLALAITAVITTGLVLYAFFTKGDLTTFGGCLYSFLICLVCASIVMCFLPYNAFAAVAFSAAGAFLFSCYIVVDVQMLMDGKRVQLSPDDS